MKPISLKQYGVRNSAHDINDILQAWVNREQEAWYEQTTPVLPKYEPAPKVKLTFRFLKHFIKSNIYEFRP